MEIYTYLCKYIDFFCCIKIRSLIMKNIFTEKKSGNDNRANRKQIQRGKQVIES